MAVLRTTSDSKEYQAEHPIAPEHEFIVSIGPHGLQKLEEVFNRHAKGKIEVAMGSMYWVSDISWDIINELRVRDDVTLCGPAAGTDDVTFCGYIAGTSRKFQR